MFINIKYRYASVNIELQFTTDNNSIYILLKLGLQVLNTR